MQTVPACAPCDSLRGVTNGIAAPFSEARRALVEELPFEVCVHSVTPGVTLDTA